MRDAAAGLELPENPHPSLSRDTFSHKWEKGLSRANQQADLPHLRMLSIFVFISA